MNRAADFGADTYTEKLVRESLRAEGAQLFIQAGATRYRSHYVPDTSDFILPEFTIHSAGYNAFLPHLQTRLRLFLFRGAEERTELAALPVTLSAEPLVVRNLAVKVRDGSLGATSDACCLVLMIADRRLASLAFQIVSCEEVLERVTVVAITLEATSKSGILVRNPALLRTGEHEAFGVVVEIEVGLLAPNMAVECALVLKFSDDVVGHANAELQLHRPQQTIRGAKVPLASIVRGQSLAPQELTVVVWIAGEEKGTRSVTIISVERISNFEGQLTIDPHKLEVDDTEYEEVLRRL